MLDTIVVDDEEHAGERIGNFISKTKKLKLIDIYQKPDKFLKDIENKKYSPKLVFLDIKMPEKNGLKLAQRILEIDEKIDIVFVTAYKKYAVEAFELNAMDYLLKPITEDRFAETLSRLSLKKENSHNKTSKLWIATLGRFEIYYNNKEVNLDFPTAKTKELFLFLLFNRGDFVKSDKILDKLWSNKSIEKAKDLLYTTVYSLRKIFSNFGLEDIILSKRGYYSINKKKVSWDVVKFEKLYDLLKNNLSDNIEKTEKIMKLYKNEYLINKNYEWSYPLRIELKEKYKELMLKIADYYLQKEEYKESEEILKKVLKKFYLPVEIHKSLIEVYKKQGKKAAARKQYKILKDSMIEEFGIKPNIDLE